MKAKSKNFKGIEYVIVTELPDDQKTSLELTSNLERIKILIDGKIVDNCISYEEYSRWYQSVFFVQRSASLPKPSEKSIPLKVAANKV